MARSSPFPGSVCECFKEGERVVSHYSKRSGYRPELYSLMTTERDDPHWALYNDPHLYTRLSKLLLGFPHAG